MIDEWIRQVIEGPGGFNLFVEREWVEMHASEHVCVAAWVLRCLANPHCEGAAAVLAAIHERRCLQAEVGQERLPL